MTVAVIVLSLSLWYYGLPFWSLNKSLPNSWKQKHAGRTSQTNQCQQGHGPTCSRNSNSFQTELEDKYLAGHVSFISNEFKTTESSAYTTTLPISLHVSCPHLINCPFVVIPCLLVGPNALIFSFLLNISQANHTNALNFAKEPFSWTSSEWPHLALLCCLVLWCHGRHIVGIWWIFADSSEFTINNKLLLLLQKTLFCSCFSFTSITLNHRTTFHKTFALLQPDCKLGIFGKYVWEGGQERVELLML